MKLLFHKFGKFYNYKVLWLFSSLHLKIEETFFLMLFFYTWYMDMLCGGMCVLQTLLSLKPGLEAGILNLILLIRKPVKGHEAGPKSDRKRPNGYLKWSSCFIGCHLSPMTQSFPCPELWHHLFCCLNTKTKFQKAVSLPESGDKSLTSSIW
jgi:hypothetical protein